MCNSTISTADFRVSEIGECGEEDEVWMGDQNTQWLPVTQLQGGEDGQEERRKEGHSGS